MKEKKSAIIIYTFLIIQPFLDLFTSLMVRFNLFPITIGMLIRGLFLLYCFILFLKNYKKEYKKWYIYIFILFIYFVFYLLLKEDALNINYLFTEIVYLFKYMYFPLITIFLLNVYDKINLKKENIFKIFIINSLIYSLLIIIPEISGTAFSSYIGTNKGTVGWFFAANEIGAIIVALFPFLYYLLFERIPFFKIFVILCIIILSSVLLGTKTSYLGIIITELLFFVYYFINRKKNRGYGFIISLFIVLMSIVIVPNIPAVSNLQNSIKQSSEITEDNRFRKTNNKLDRVLNVILSGRHFFLVDTYEIYKNQNIKDKLFGIGFINRKNINNSNIEKIIEMDLFDIYFHYGIIGFIIYFIPIMYITFKFIKYSFENRFRLSYYKLTNFYVICILTFISLLAGHVYSAPSVSIYVAFSIIMLNNGILRENENIIRERKKISILALHLGYGGVEQYISSLCKMLNENYDIEIISTYKVMDKPAFYFDKNIKITYLINDKPNKEKLIKAFKEKNVIEIFFEGFKALKIIILKYSRNINAIRSIYSDYIITTRTFHNKLVSKYAYWRIKKIATEHNYHQNNKQYVNNLITSIKGFDYFVLVSNNLKEYYENKVKNVKCIYIPNVIDDISDNKSELNKNILINVGRLEKEKDQEILIEVFYNVRKKIKDAKLYIIGDGSLKEKINNKIEEYDLEKSVILTGFLTKKEMEKYFLDAKLFVMTSITESFGLVLLEAMSYGVPCIAFDSADGANYLLREDNGVLIRNRDVKAMSSKIVELLNDKKQLIKIKNNSEKEVNKYLSKNVEKLWKEILK